MNRRQTPSTRRWRLHLNVIVAISCAAASLLQAAFGAAAEPPFDVRPRPAELIQPGLVVEQGPPDGWSCLVIKSQPRVTQGDLDRVGKIDVQMASMFFTVLAADVQAASETSPAKITRIGVGVGTDLRGKPTVVSPDTQRRQGARLGLIGGMVLRGFYDEQQEVRIVASRDEAVFVDTPVAVRIDEQNQEGVVRYALLLGPGGKISVYCWLIACGARGDYLDLRSEIQHLSQDHVEDAQLYVSRDEYRFGLATKRAFAIVSVPQGESSVPAPDKLAGLFAKQRPEPGEFAAMEAWLRDSTRVAVRP